MDSPFIVDVQLDPRGLILAQASTDSGLRLLHRLV